MRVRRCSSRRRDHTVSAGDMATRVCSGALQAGDAECSPAGAVNTAVGTCAVQAARDLVICRTEAHSMVGDVAGP
jgi:hypothetical protein